MIAAVSPSLTATQFDQLAAQGYDRIALSVETLADLETPLSVYLKLTATQRARTFLLESVVGGERFGRYSFIGLSATTWCESTGQQVSEWCLDSATQQTRMTAQITANPLDYLSTRLQRRTIALPKDAPRFCGGLAGYLGYEMVRQIEPRLQHTAPSQDVMGTPDMRLLDTEELAVIDNLKGTLQLIVYADPQLPNAYALAIERLTLLQQRLSIPATIAAPQGFVVPDVQRPFTHSQFLAAVARAKAYIEAGDMMQVVLAKPLSCEFAADPIHLYRALRTANPSPYMYFYDMGEFQIVGASPEILVRQEVLNTRKKITVRPLAGTRRRGNSPEADLALEKELLADEKERAEHLMLIDLARNDIGKVARTGSVKVTESFKVERYSQVMHIVSNVEGELEDHCSAVDVFRATFPAGTLSGAPKVRAMEIIDELEPLRRGVYGGAVGYFSYAGDMDLAIAIRTALIKDKILHTQAGAGIVADSDPESEWQETENKARAILQAVQRVAHSFTEPVR